MHKSIKQRINEPQKVKPVGPFDNSQFLIYKKEENGNPISKISGAYIYIFVC